MGRGHPNTYSSTENDGFECGEAGAEVRKGRARMTRGCLAGEPEEGVLSLGRAEVLV